MCRCGYALVLCEMREVGADGSFSELPGVLFVVEENELAAPTDVGVFCAWTVAATGDFIGELLEELSFGCGIVWMKKGVVSSVHGEPRRK